MAPELFYNVFHDMRRCLYTCTDMSSLSARPAYETSLCADSGTRIQFDLQSARLLRELRRVLHIEPVPCKGRNALQSTTVC